MAYQHENAMAICLSSYSLFLELLGIDNQKKKFEEIKDELTDRKVTIEQDLFLGDALCTLRISVTNDGKLNHVKFNVAGSEFDSFRVPSDAENIVPKFKKEYSSKLNPMIDHIKQMLKKG